MGAIGALTPAAAHAGWVTVGRDCATNQAGSLCAERQVDPDAKKMRGRWSVIVAGGEWIRPSSGYLAFSTRSGRLIGPCGTTMAGTQVACEQLSASQSGPWYEPSSGETRGVFGYTAATSTGELRVAAGDTGWRAVAKPRCRDVAAGRVCVNIGERFIGLRLRRRMDAATVPRRGRWIAATSMTMLVRQNRQGSEWQETRRVLCRSNCGARSTSKRPWHGVFIEDVTHQGMMTVRVARFDFSTPAGRDVLEMVDK